MDTRLKYILRKQQRSKQGQNKEERGKDGTMQPTLSPKPQRSLKVYICLLGSSLEPGDLWAMTKLCGSSITGTLGLVAAQTLRAILWP